MVIYQSRVTVAKQRPACRSGTRRRLGTSINAFATTKGLHYTVQTLMRYEYMKGSMDLPAPVRTTLQLALALEACQISALGDSDRLLSSSLPS
jgi:hypothetical protein